MRSDVVIIGGGVIGLSLARELAGKGRRVTLLDRTEPGREASWAGAGILPPGRLDRAAQPLDRLRALSATLWTKWTESLRGETGMENGYLRCGGLTVSLGAESCEPYLAEWQAEQVEVELLDRAGVQRYEPAITGDVTFGFRLPELSQVRNPWHLRALEASCRSRGVEILTGRAVCSLEFSGERLRAISTESEQFVADQFCFCTGAWMGLLSAGLPAPIPIVPVRGQIVLLRTQRPVLRHVIEVGKRYLVPRADGRILVGATEESVGFQKMNTAEGVSGLIEFALKLVPELKSAAVETQWSGLRPACERGYPYLGRLPACSNGFIAAGHFRSGLQTSPGTALLLGQLMCGEVPAIDLAAFEPQGA